MRHAPRDLPLTAPPGEAGRGLVPLVVWESREAHEGAASTLLGPQVSDVFQAFVSMGRRGGPGGGVVQRACQSGLGAGSESAGGLLGDETSGSVCPGLWVATPEVSA